MALTKTSSPIALGRGTSARERLPFPAFPRTARDRIPHRASRAPAHAGTASPSGSRPARSPASPSSITSCFPPSIRASRTSCASACTCRRSSSCWCCTSKRFYDRWYDLGISIVAPVFGIGTVIMAAFSPPAEVPLIGGRLLLASFFFYFMVGLRLREAVARQPHRVRRAGRRGPRSAPCPPRPRPTCCSRCSAPTSSAVAGSYALEHANRTAFLEHRQLTEVATHDGLTRC